MTAWFYMVFYRYSMMTGMWQCYRTRSLVSSCTCGATLSYKLGEVTVLVSTIHKKIRHMLHCPLAHLERAGTLYRTVHERTAHRTHRKQSLELLSLYLCKLYSAFWLQLPVPAPRNSSAE
jgi:hypothetical protein